MDPSQLAQSDPSPSSIDQDTANVEPLINDLLGLYAAGMPMAPAMQASPGAQSLQLSASTEGEYISSLDDEIEMSDFEPSPSVSPAGRGSSRRDELRARRAQRPTKRRRRLTSAETEALIAEYAHDPKPTTDKRNAIADRLNMTPRVVQVWFQNRRAKVKRESAEKQSPQDPSTVTSLAAQTTPTAMSTSSISSDSSPITPIQARSTDEPVTPSPVVRHGPNPPAAPRRLSRLRRPHSLTFTDHKTGSALPDRPLTPSSDFTTVPSSRITQSARSRYTPPLTTSPHSYDFMFQAPATFSPEQANFGNRQSLYWPPGMFGSTVTDHRRSSSNPWMASNPWQPLMSPQQMPQTLPQFSHADIFMSPEHLQQMPLFEQQIMTDILPTLTTRHVRSFSDVEVARRSTPAPTTVPIVSTTAPAAMTTSSSSSSSNSPEPQPLPSNAASSSFENAVATASATVEHLRTNPALRPYALHWQNTSSKSLPSDSDEKSSNDGSLTPEPPVKRRRSPRNPPDAI